MYPRNLKHLPPLDLVVRKKHIRRNIENGLTMKKTKSISLRNGESCQAGPGIVVTLNETGNGKAWLSFSYPAGISIEKVKKPVIIPAESNRATANATPAQ